MNENNGIELSLANPGGEPVVYRNCDPVLLTLTMVNRTGTGINLSGSARPVLDIYFNSCFTPQETSRMKAAATGWDFSYDPAYDSLTLTWGGSERIWNDGTAITVGIDNAATGAQPGIGSMQVNFTGFPDSVQYMQLVPLTVANAPVPGNAKLEDALSITLDNQGTVFCSEPDDPLRNSLLLNIKNTAAEPLYTGKKPAGNPSVEVTFVYGSTGGSLTPDDRLTCGYSAWDIRAKVSYQLPEYQWQALNPSYAGPGRHPSWRLVPAAGNAGILGTGENANITFDFSEIIAYTPPGHTQMMLHLSGFMKDESTPYDDMVCVLDIVKSLPPAMRGVVNFFGTEPLVTAFSPEEEIAVELKWLMYNVGEVYILSNIQGITPKKILYPDFEPVANDRCTVSFSGIKADTTVIMTIQAYDGKGGFLNSMQFTVYVRAQMFTDPRDGNVYPAVKIGNKLWTTANLKYLPPSGSTAYGSEEPYGRLYRWQALRTSSPMNGWRLPTPEDWEELFGFYGERAYDELVAGGNSGFDAVLGGVVDTAGSRGLGQKGYYWTADETEGKGRYAFFSSAERRVTAEFTIDKQAYLCARYVKDDDLT